MKAHPDGQDLERGRAWGGAPKVGWGGLGRGGGAGTARQSLETVLSYWQGPWGL